MNIFIFLFLVLSFFVFLINWRFGIYICVFAGFVQDPVRKMIIGQPVYFQLLVGALLGALFLKILLIRVNLNWSLLSGHDQNLKQAWLLFIVLVFFQSLHTIVRFNSPILAGLGFFSWIMPLLGIMIGNAFVQNEDSINKFLKFYVWLAVPFGLSIYLSGWFGNSYDILKDIGCFSGKELVIYHSGSVLYSYSGLFRVGEIASWHAATASIVLIMLATLNRSLTFRVLAALLVVVLIGAILMTGRRKMLMTIILFTGMYWFMLTFFWGKSAKLSIFVLLVCILGSIMLWIYSPEGEQAIYVERGASVFDSIPDRFDTVINLFESGINRYGIWGAGAGVISSGSQYFGGGGEPLVGGAGEAGLGRIVTELGIIGLLVITWLLLMIARFFNRAVRYTPSKHFSLTVYMAGFLSILIANGTTFFAATQLYGDMFILILLGLMTGFLFATERLSRQHLFWEEKVTQMSTVAQNA